MSGWVKWEKDIETDPRFVRMVRAIRVTHERDGSVTGALPLATLVVGSLLRFWSYADTHIRSDDTLDLGLADIDDLVGVLGFAASMPEDWLKVVDERTVELPGYQEHNGVEAKKRDLAQKRQERKREKDKRTTVTHLRDGSVTPALTKRDQTRPDQKRPDQTRTESQTRASPKPIPEQGGLLGGGTERVEPEVASLPRARAFAHDPHEVTERCKASYPKGTYTGVTWIHAERCIGKLLEEGADPDELIANTEAYRDQQVALGKAGTQFVLSPKSFFADGHWQGPFPLPASTAAPAKRIRLASEIAEEYEARERAAQS